jgi:hypothetical protein
MQLTHAIEEVHSKHGYLQGWQYTGMELVSGKDFDGQVLRHVVRSVA